MTANRAGATAQEVGSRPSTAFWWLHWTLTALAALSFAIGLFHLDSDAFWYFSASMVLATAVATANLVHVWLAQRRNWRAQTLRPERSLVANGRAERPTSLWRSRIAADRRP